MPHGPCPRVPPEWRLQAKLSKLLYKLSNLSLTHCPHSRSLSLALSFYGSCLAWEVVDLDGVGRQASRTDHSRQFIIRAAAAAVGGSRKSSLWSLLLLLRPIPSLHIHIPSIRSQPVCNTSPAQLGNYICNGECWIWFNKRTRTMRNFYFQYWTSCKQIRKTSIHWL